ncbi:hypothetical protein [Phocaeicola sp.]|uniref:hypothetical protein n=1 Tax=Phocaeicola sp. TaxID=2773926 RepID=UPI00283E28BF|nr:hypothetical protein [Phocaeicola sp.]MDR3795575.1 hypothetical protein [Phocaeicola sp.]
MKKIYYCLGIALAACLSSCSDDSLDNGKAVVNPVQTGDEIIFGSSLSENTDMESRTVYGDRTTTGVPVYWSSDEEKPDTIAIYCMQSSQPADHLVKYIVTPSESNQAVAASVDKLDPNAAGLQWGDRSTPHRFYAFYPAGAVKGTDDEDATGQITANIPVTQQVQEWRTVEAGASGSLEGKKTYFGLPNMDYAYMYAYNEVTPEDMEGSTVDLKFKNLVTVLDITVQGPQSGTATITNINVDAVEGSQPILTGDFKCDIRAAKTDGTVVCTPVGSFNEERGRISIPCYDKKSGQFIQLGPNELLNVKAYIIPQDEKNTVVKQSLRVTVSLLNGAPCKKTLETADVTPHKINRVILPKLEVGGTNYWMSSLDRDIYVSELSLPGSKFAYATPDNGVTVRNFQNATITQQFTSGVRAFIVQTAGYAEYTRSGWGTVYTHNNSGKDDLYVTVNGNILQKDGKNVTIKDVLDELKACIDEAKKAKGESNNEYVVVQLTFEGNPCNSNYGNFNSERIWIEALQAKLNSLISENSYNLYTDEITANTTIRDLREHIVLKVNYNSTAMGSYIAQDAMIPALFSKWQGKYGDVDLRWGTPNESSTRTPMHWLYQEATHVGSNTEITYQEKLDYIKKVFEDGVTRYQQNTEHDTWFMNDIGGRYIEDTDDAVTRLTTELNNYSVGLLQNRTANASLGLIFMNFADKVDTSGALYKSDWLIQTIIDNNFKFALRKVPSSSTTTSYNASDKTRVNTVGWDK